MVKRTVNCPDNEPEKMKHELPSEKEHLFQVSDIYTKDDEIGVKLNLDDDTVSAQCEIVGGDEEGRTLLCRLSLDESFKGFFFTRLFLKAISEPHKGKGIEIDTERWAGRQFYATVVHNGQYANIDVFNYDKKIEQQYQAPTGTKPVTEPKDIAWNE